MSEEKKGTDNRKVLKLNRSVDVEKIRAAKQVRAHQGVEVEIRGYAADDSVSFAQKPRQIEKPKINAHVRPASGRKLTSQEREARESAIARASSFFAKSQQEKAKHAKVFDRMDVPPVVESAKVTPKPASDNDKSKKKDGQKSYRVERDVKKGAPAKKYKKGAPPKRPQNNTSQRSSYGTRSMYIPKATFPERASLKGHQPKKGYVATAAALPKNVLVSGEMRVKEVAMSIALKSKKIIYWLRDMGVQAGDDTVLDIETVVMIIEAMGHTAIVSEVSEKSLLTEMLGENLEADETRMPVLAIMGHVDHGKTTLVDALCGTRRASKEAGGITQDVRGYKAKLPSGSYMTLIDTPGHEAFKAIRARGAEAVDMVLLIVAADDGPKPQTEEAINYLKEQEIPFIVVLTKMDKVDDTHKVINALMRYEIVPESMGGSNLFVEISAPEGRNIPELCELIELQAADLGLMANKKAWTRGVVLDAQVSKGLGVVCNVLVQDGTLSVGDYVVVDSVGAKVRALRDVHGKTVKAGYPSDVVVVIGLPDTPRAGTTLVGVKDAQGMQTIIDWRKQEFEKGVKTAERSFFWQRPEQETCLPLIIRADAQGSAEALEWVLKDLVCEEWSVRILSADVGSVTASVLDFAKTAGAAIVMFNVGCERNVENDARKERIEIFQSNIIYDLEKKITAHMKSLCVPKFEEIVRGKGEVIQVFDISKYGRVAGCAVKEGSFTTGMTARITRGDTVLCQQKITSLRKEKDEMREVGVGFNAGIFLEGFEAFEVGDVVECLEIRQIQS
ncbi:MAG: translation initiation factor IF-2 [Alphaproteobacteria bacterium]|nr:translation initiation factor IF-2 [Alphaproteobacteria bacterium]